MKNCIILGSGRSGTSMVAGALARSGYFMGGRLHRPRAANPKGFFEAARVNRINDALIRQVVPAQWPVVGRWSQRDRPGRTQMWLARLATGRDIPGNERLEGKIAQLTRREPFCFKDPRFCYTLPVWRPYLRDAVFVCVFREPAFTVQSILKECRERRYRNMAMDDGWAYDVFACMYGHVLKRHRHEGQWLFLHYDQVLDGSALERLEHHVYGTVDRQFPDTTLKRSVVERPMPAAVHATYEQLCALAGYTRRIEEKICSARE